MKTFETNANSMMLQERELIQPIALSKPLRDVMKGGFVQQLGAVLSSKGSS